MPNQSKKGKSKVHYGWIVATGGFFTQTILLIGMSTFPLIVVTVKEALGISNLAIGSIIAMYGILYVSGAPVWGLVGDRIGLRKSLTLSSILTSIGIMFMGAINSNLTGMVVYSLIGFGSSALITLLPKLTTVWFDINRRGLASSYITSGGSAPASILGIVVPILVIVSSWRITFYALGLVSLFLSLIIYLLVSNSPDEKGLAPVGATVKSVSKIVEADTEERMKTRDVLKMRTTWHIAAIYFTFFISVLTTITFLVAYLIEIGLPHIDAGVGYSVLMLAMLFGQYLWGFLSDYVPRKTVIMICAILLAVFTCIFLTLGMDKLSIYSMVCFMGISTGVTPVIYATVCDYFNSCVIGTATGIIMCVAGISSILAPLIGGYLVTITGTLATVFQMSIIMACLSAVLSIVLKTLPQRKG